MRKTCIICGVEQDISEFGRQKETRDGHVNQCRTCLNERQRTRRKKNGNAITHKYEKTKKGFLMREYRNMQSRVTGVQKKKSHLYLGKELLPRSDFYEWALKQPSFWNLFKVWEHFNYDRKWTPTVDRIDSDRGYVLDNVEWVTHSENSRRGSLSPKRQAYYS